MTSGTKPFPTGATARMEGMVGEGDNLLRRGDRTSAEYRRLVTRAGFSECDTALPL
jgi:hypothetical protein